MINFSDWFQLGLMPANVIYGKYDLVLVVLSYVVAVFASYAALNLVGRLRAEQNTPAQIYWLAGGAFTMGAGIWSMHFIGMLAFIMPMPMQYEWLWTSSSLLIAILASALALFILQKQHYSTTQFALGGLIIGLAISTMHYMGMEGMKTHINIHYIPGLFFLSVLIGIIAAEVAIYLALQSNKGSNRRQFYLKIISSLIMGFAVCGMHYTGMFAAVFTPNPSHVMGQNVQEIPTTDLAFFIAGITALIISLALTASISYKKMNVAVENEKNFLKAMLNNLEDGIIACDANGFITVFNQSLQKNIVAVQKQMHVDDLDNYFSLFTPDNKLLHKQEWPLSLALKGKPVQGVELIMQFKNNELREVVIDGQQIINSEGENLGAVAVIHDVTELKRTEKIKHEFISMVSHELRTPLTSIRGSLGLLVSGLMGSFSKRAQNLLEIANSNCERLLLLINDILDLEKIEIGKMDFQLKNHELNQIVTESIAANKMYADKYDLSLELVPAPSPIFVHVDSSRLLQVLANLISNACKFSPQGGCIKILVQQINSVARVSVSDNGSGISEEFQARIFQKFSQADSSDTRGKGGTGLGLNISKGIMEQLDGTLNFICPPEGGTTFYFELPVSEEQTTSMPTYIEKQSKETKRLLVCDDDVDQSEYLKALLESAGFLVDTADSVGKAKQLITEHYYQALLLDLILPDQDGITFIRELRTDEKTKDLHIIVISVISKTGKSVLDGDAVLVVDWFDKPIDFNKLLSSINRIKIKKQIPLPHILHIEDNEDTQHIVSTLLESHASVSVAGSLQQAKGMLEKNNYDLIILDLVLPDGNGAEILPLLVQYHVPVLVFSDMQFNKDYSHYVSDVLMKSSSSNEMLLDTIKNLLL